MKITLLAATIGAAWALHAQDVNPLSREAKQAYTTVKNDILKSAEKMPEENYGFKPAPRVRNFAQILGHVAEEQYFFCGSVKGEQKAADIEKTRTSKAELFLRKIGLQSPLIFNGLAKSPLARSKRLAS